LGRGDAWDKTACSPKKTKPNPNPKRRSLEGPPRRQAPNAKGSKKRCTHSPAQRKGHTRAPPGSGSRGFRWPDALTVGAAGLWWISAPHAQIDIRKPTEGHALDKSTIEIIPKGQPGKTARPAPIAVLKTDHLNWALVDEPSLGFHENGPRVTPRGRSSNGFPDPPGPRPIQRAAGGWGRTRDDL